MAKAYLLLWLEAPLQSWGHDSKFGRRDTLNFPTKSGILGLLCCALGKGGAQREFLTEFSQLPQIIITYARSRKNANNEMIKIDSEPLLRDFHMIGSGYNDKDPWQRLLIPKTREGKKAVGGGAKLTYRYYLQDARFAVIMEIPGNQATALEHALQNPVWDLYLGRKSCVPTDFIYRGIFESEQQARAEAKKIAEEKSLLEDFQVWDGEHDGDETFTLTDVPVCFGEYKQYRDRRVTLIYHNDEL
ncbi:type I-E CRISPR-associated protein Cas5/CasD [Candidatus Venteria ishoeyi]|uniref:type I-E CRISPR-associated protein Cas5/CasD n=1 Tax=Candidatus Venteria ishoeyi TaxID=1899563 RepID=UPI0025A51533|nr:type I-E CRISPR-associated protein Cas5/CasD [Candidatus Venteria ishoeyi]MDM8545406.1 type I-E CRISPR-associated protein Cas5/CasD [Candidatus Venteria ishoeyi]